MFFTRLSMPFTRAASHCTGRIRATATIAVAACGLGAGVSQAVDRVTLQIGSVSAPDVRVSGIRAGARLIDDEHMAVQIDIDRADVVAGLEPVRGLRVVCESALLSGTRAACGSMRIDAKRSPAGALSMTGSIDSRGEGGSLVAHLRGARFAGGTLRVAARRAAAGWRATADLEGAQLAALRTFLARWVTVPQEWSADARLTASASLSGGTDAAGDLRVGGAAASLSIVGLELTNEPGTIVAEKTNLSIDATFDPRAGANAVAAQVRGTSGQALAGPVLLDFNAHPLDMKISGTLDDDSITLTRLDIAQPGLLVAHGDARILLGETPSLSRARVVIERLEFPAAYPSFMQLTLAATDFGDLTTAGTATGEIELAANAILRVSMRLEDLQMRDRDGDFFIKDLHGIVRWTSDAAGEAADSWLSWSAGGAYGLTGGASRLDFRARGARFELVQPARLPIFDGAVAIDTLSVEDLDSDRIGLAFAGAIEPISMAPICRAFGWPEFSGSIAGTIPSVQLRNDELRFDGDVEAQIFDGRVVASNVRLVDPLGSWPRLFADVRARGLDLALLTATFSVGSITGRVDADVLGIELFDWTPIAFDGRIQTSPGDRSRHRISARAVSELANIGGGGGGVAQALQSGVLRFFDEYSYDRLGLRCKLQNDVCLMAGVAPAGDQGYYIVKGSGIPRIDIIGNEGRVNWPQLLSQIQAGMQSEGVVVQ